jgi:hypothetical protein
VVGTIAFDPRRRNHSTDCIPSGIARNSRWDPASSRGQRNYRRCSATSKAAYIDTTSGAIKQRLTDERSGSWSETRAGRPCVAPLRFQFAGGLRSTLAKQSRR